MFSRTNDGRWVIRTKYHDDGYDRMRTMDAPVLPFESKSWEYKSRSSLKWYNDNTVKLKTIEDGETEIHIYRL